MSTVQKALAAWWTFDGAETEKAVDRVGEVADRIEGRYKCVDGVVGRALKFDGFTTAVVREAGAFRGRLLPTQVLR